jgi:hypothetical protein
MKKTYALMGLMALAPMAVVISCVSAATRIDDGRERVSMNTGPDARGEIHSVQVIDTLERVLVLDMNDKGKRIELASRDWSYDPLTTKLTVTKPIPYVNPIYRLEGTGFKPARFILQSLKPGETPVVFVAGRVALEGVDYEWDGDRALLTMRRDVKTDEPGFFVDYRTTYGSSCFGNMGANETADAIQYYLAQRRREEWKREIDQGGELPFLEIKSDGVPIVVMRKPDATKRAEMAEESVPVIKCRDKGDAEIAKEAGFDARLPAKVPLGGKAFAIAGIRMILETARGGEPRTSVMCYYQFSDRIQGAEEDSIPITLSLYPPTATDDNAEFEIESVPMRGAPLVTKTTFWTVRQDETGYAPVKSVAYRGTRNGVHFEVICSTDAQTTERAEKIILAFLRHR